MNPAAKVFSRSELQLIADLVIRHDAIAICDEVYEHVLFDGLSHIPLMTLPGMRERTIRIGSAGKTFSLTGWKVGYVTAPARLLDPIAKAHQFTTFTTPPNLQKAVAYGLAKDDSYYASLAGDLEVKRDRFAAGLARLGFGVVPCAGPISSPPTSRRSASTSRTANSASGSPSRRASRPSRSRPSTSPTRRRASSASASPSATRFSTRRWSGWRVEQEAGSLASESCRGDRPSPMPTEQGGGLVPAKACVWRVHLKKVTRRGQTWLAKIVRYSFGYRLLADLSSYTRSPRTSLCFACMSGAGPGPGARRYTGGRRMRVRPPDTIGKRKQMGA